MIWTEMNIKDNKNVIDVPKDIYYIFDIQHHDSKDFLEISNNLNKNNRRFLTTAEVLASICHGHIANDIKILGSVCN
jgi:hypothetical protein